MTTRLFPAFALVLILAISGCTTTPTQVGSSSSGNSAKQAAHVILVRGGVGGVFSEGLDEIASKLRARGVPATTIGQSQSGAALTRIPTGRTAAPIILIGHSIGALRVASMARALRQRRQPVAYMATIAASGTLNVPAGVRKAANYYFSKDGWGTIARAERGFTGRLQNIDLSKRKTVGHFDADEDPRIQRQIIDNVVRIVRRAKRRR
ncbi:lipase [Rhizobiaceae bacterium]|nr:lipase [Rhizobiaceae bacterium]